MSVFKRWNGSSWETIGPQISSTRFDDTNHMIAPEYSSTSTYNVGDYVVQSDKLYRCISVIESAEEWTAAHWTQISMSGEISDLNSALNDTHGLINQFNYELKDVDLIWNTATGYWDSTKHFSTYSNITTAIVDCTKNREFVLHGRNYYAMSVVIFYYGDNIETGWVKAITLANDSSTFDLEIVVPEKADKMLIQRAYNYTTTLEVVSNIRNIVDNLSLQLDDIGQYGLTEIPLDFSLASGYIDTNHDFQNYNNTYTMNLQVNTAYKYYYSFKSFYGVPEVIFYDTNNNIIGHQLTSNDDAVHTNQEIIFPQNCTHILLQQYGLSSVQNICNLNIEEYQIKNDKINIYNVPYKITNVGDTLDNITTVTTTKELISLNWELGSGYYDKNGSLATYGNIYWATVDVQSNTTYSLTAKSYFAMALAIFYTGDDPATGFVGSVITGEDSSLNTNLEVIIPDGATHMLLQQAYDNRSILMKIIPSIIPSQNNYLYHKLIAYNGDSICESRLSGAAANGGAYAHIISELTNSYYENRGVSGGILASAVPEGDAPGRFVVSDVQNMTSAADLICFEGGINDFWRNVPLGNFSESDFNSTLDDTTVCGALESIFRQAINKWVGKPICFVIVHHPQGTFSANSAGYTFAEMREKMIGICHKYAIPFYDASTESGLNGNNLIQNQNFLTGGQSKPYDGIHPNEEGYKKYYVPQLIDLFNRIMPRN